MGSNDGTMEAGGKIMSMYGKWPKNADGTEKKARPVVDCTGDKVITVQSDRKEADINEIIKRIEKGAMTATLNKNEPFYGDVSEFNGLQDAIIKVQDAQDLFMGMSAVIRERFDNDPVKMVEFLQDEGNRKEAEELGMVVPRPVAQPGTVPSSPPPGGNPA